MSNYTIRAVDADLIALRAAEFNDKVTMYFPYKFEPTSFDDAEGVHPAAGYVTIGDNQHYIVRPDECGFVVKKIYVEDENETDPVLRAWGVWAHLSMWDMADRRLQQWL